MLNVNYSMKIEDVHINFLTYTNDTLLKRGNQISWSSIKEDKKHVGDNTVAYLAEVNNGYKKEVTFRLVQVTTKLTNDDNVRRQYTEVVMEDVDGEFGKIICNTNDVKKATKTLKNKMSVEYRKTLEKRIKDTKELKEQNTKLNKDLDDAKKIDLLHQQQATRKYAELNEKYTAEQQSHEGTKYDLMVTKNELTVTKRKLDEALKYSIKELTINDFVAIGKLYVKKTLKMKTDEEFGKAVMEYFETKVKRENK